MSLGPVRALAMLLLLVGVVGCVRKERPVDSKIIRSVRVEGDQAVDDEGVKESIATAKSSRFLGIWDGVLYEYEVFDENVLERDLARIERYYRARGYYEAKVTAARVVPHDEHRVKVQIRVYEGDPVRVAGDVAIRTPFGHPLSGEASELKTLLRGDRFDEAEYEAMKERLRRLFADRGYAYVKVEGDVLVNMATKEARIQVNVIPGPLTVFGEVEIVGLRKVPEDKVRDFLKIEKNTPYSEADLEDARDALNNLGVFSSVEIRQDLDDESQLQVPITVVVREAKLRTLRIGGGAEVDQTRLSTHLRIGWESRNFLGGVRRFSIDDKPGVVLWPTRIPSSSTRGSDAGNTPPNFPPADYFPENRLRTEFEQPALFEGRTTGFVSNEFNIVALIIDRTIPPRDEPVIGFLEVKNQIGVKRRFFGQRLEIIPSYNWNADFPFTYRNDLEPGTRDVRVSFPQLVVQADLRDDPIRPRDGVFLRNSFQVAGYIFGGHADDVKLQPEVRFYKSVNPPTKSVVLATRATVGFVFPRLCNTIDDDTDRDGCYGDSLVDEDPENDLTRDQQIQLFRGFYSGGANSNRGYGFRGVGPHGPLRFLTPRSRCPDDVLDRDVVPRQCIRPKGGFTLWEASLELRFPIFGPLTGATFLDASDVNNDVGELRFDFPHLSTGFGVRYDTPIGPFRLDVGIRVPRAQQIGKATLRIDEGDPGEICFRRNGRACAPIAIHLGLGEAF